MGDIREIHICGYSDVGRTRTRNEDAFLVGNIIERKGLVNVDISMDSTSVQEQGILIAVADGMGGMGSGDVASILGLQAFSNHYYGNISPDASEEDVNELLRQSILHAHQLISEASASKEDGSRMGTTLVGLNVIKGGICRYHAGDSRLYRYRAKELRQITKDHSFVQMLVDSGKLSEDEAESHSRKNEITNSLGGGSTCKPEIVRLTEKDARAGDIFLLCSDGLSNMLDHNETEPEFDALSQLLIQAESKEKDLESIKKNLCAGQLYEQLEPVLEGIDRAFSEKENHDPYQKRFDDVCKSISQIHSNWQGWRELLAIFLAEKEKNPISEILDSPLGLDEKTMALIDAANQRKARDNVTVILVEFR